ncbi:hypoxanthine-guanine phosphoribosyltransferase [Geobacter sp. SVR]|uniref:hypoxanthine-guanine phosphoribosyltransferase n=1 Tax=Geobacter sp. SVR TaxID=2495594 RepID=UPI00143EFEB3|nr:hypoxanthine-guanine phosphoribosyltransferase [Geobacter sp. SVR]BCS52699.1 hypoxanthine-guanine phosphoribosyltransferase [Geobacter sp. SVR]GCF86805.1 hypoxanthine-guanine phosphoribosyltransferase [Geobacter sp. SVR]
MTVEEANNVLREADLLIGEAEVAAAIGRMAEELTQRLADANPVVFCVMNGGLIFAGQLLTRLVFPLEAAYLHATRYGHETSGGHLNWIVRPQAELRGRTVLLLDDILDEGVTLAAIADYCRAQGAAEVLMAVLVDKRHERKVSPGFRADVTGIETEDRFLFGYGLDYKGYWRNAPGIYAVKGV